MRFDGNRAAGWILAVAFVVTAGFKVERFAVGTTRWTMPVLFMASIIAVEVCLAVALCSRARGGAAVWTLIFIAGANVYRISAGLASRATYDCGCLGSTHIGPVHHALLSCAFVALSCVIILDNGAPASR